MKGSDYIRDAVIIAFSLNELVSIFENAGLMGIKMPTVITKAIDSLKGKGNKGVIMITIEDFGFYHPSNLIAKRKHIKRFIGDKATHTGKILSRMKFKFNCRRILKF